MAWAENLTVSFAGNTYDDWRLPLTTPVNGISYNYIASYDGATDVGWNNKASEMAYLFYNGLNSIPYWRWDSVKQEAWTLGSGALYQSPFKNLWGENYYSGTVYDDYPNSAWTFHLGEG